MKQSLRRRLSRRRDTCNETLKGERLDMLNILHKLCLRVQHWIWQSYRNVIPFVAMRGLWQGFAKAKVELSAKNKENFVVLPKRIA